MTDHDVSRIADKGGEVEVTVTWRGRRYVARGIPVNVQVDSQYESVPLDPFTAQSFLVNQTFTLVLTKAVVESETARELPSGDTT